MTRDEAIKIFAEKDVGKHWHADWIDKLAALGVLKLDAPPLTAEDRFTRAIFPSGPGERHISGLLEAIDKAGLKVVEK